MTSSFDELLKIQRMMQEKAQKEVEEDKTIELMALLGQIVPEGKKIQIEHVYYVCSQKGFSVKQIDQVIRKYVNDKVLFHPEIGYIQRVTY